MHIDNPAYTLRQFLLGIKRNADATKNLRTSIRGALDLNASQAPEDILLDKISKMISLVQSIEDTLKDYFPDEEVTAPTWKKNVLTFFTSMSMNSPAQGQINGVTPETFNELGLLSLLFKTKGEIGKLADKDLNEIRQQLNEIKESIINADLPPELKKDILHYINNIVRSLDDYSITGISPIISSVEATLGHACISPAFRDIVKNTDIGTKIKNTLKKTLDAVSSVEGVVSLGANAVTLLEYLNK